MAVEDAKVPPVPTAQKLEIRQNDDGRSFIAPAWLNWFELVKRKVDTLTALVVGTGQITGSGFAVLDGANWSTRSLQAGSNVSIANPNGVSGNPVISTSLATTGVTPGVYGDASNIPVITVDSFGRITAITTIPKAP
ncbi:MAG: hypothetical protein COW76_18810 [Shewanella sp. CG18_big_fil_WC_8_21_14_2_50_42_11]|uniref:hypothetical protein n=1 Tax=Shewanella sp. CG18_big_fil_WC_8_21_14_2_50_42_11 TaxID=1975538 RepID=UPI000C58751C|nr:hypothetical protein [Shewanella sp. CG18_big_fil_WC_8_21_14_2_50_42_11]PIP98858.1 MAG: hypothetical protein COW76_18810 [Shewanella sp. CG18_big_fil_WC_8_21_14_2_50_42_11]